MRHWSLILETDDTDYKHLHIFDMDGTLMLSPEPGWGKSWYRYHTRTPINPRGNNWDHEHSGWWGNHESLRGPKHAPFPIKPIEDTVENYHAAKRDPKNKVVIMTGRVDKPEMRDAVTKALAKIGIHGHKHGKDLFLKPPHDGETKVKTHEWKVHMLKRFATEHPNISHVHIWDDRKDHIEHFAKTIKALGKKHTLNHVDHPDWESDMPDTT